MHILNTLGPVFLVIALGALLRRYRFLDDNAARVINAACYWIGLPCLLALKIGTATVSKGDATGTIVVVLGGTVVLAVIACVVGMLLRLKSRALATFVHVVFRGNLAYVGLPIVCFAFSGSIYAGRAESVAAITLGVVVAVYNIMAVMIHLMSTHRVSLRAVKQMTKKLLCNPLLLSCLVGLMWNHWAYDRGVPLPVFAERSLVLLGQFALPMALLCVGCALATTPVRGVALGALLSALLKTVAGPLVALGIARLIGVGVMEAGVACILLGAPSAVASYVLTEQLDGEPSLAAGAIVVSTLFSAATLSIIIACI